MSKNDDQLKSSTPTTARVYSRPEVKTQKTISGIAGFIVGMLSTVVTSVILNKVVKINITNKTTDLVTTGVAKIKSFKKSKENVEEAK
jgi:hypothetical protein